MMARCFPSGGREQRVFDSGRYRPDCSRYVHDETDIQIADSSHSSDISLIVVPFFSYELRLCHADVILIIGSKPLIASAQKRDISETNFLT
ncbi:hypothetical protein GOB93_19325 [Acetobacter musti]|uniref:Uncharacterized protein n=1 Tax=Acetobacter musti TaxID=864732 RepID=A0ABX0JTC8_9PROT|nr:hypothetical protein [Acetobacter musti]NHN86753.1 hypothetical protein [Acetobacter musti]